MEAIHTKEIKELYSEYNSNENGLTEAQVEVNRKNYGINKLQERKPSKDNRWSAVSEW